MKFQPDYTIKLPDGEVPLLFNTWMFRQYSIRKGIEYDELEANISAGKPFPLTAIPEVMLLAHETYCKHNALPFSATEMDACNWIDQTGGVRSSVLYVDVYKTFLLKFLNLSENEFEIILKKSQEKEETEDKKKELTALPGMSSTSQPQKVA